MCTVNIRLAKSGDMSGIETINSVIDYNNPKEFMAETIQARRLFVAETSDQAIAGYGMYQVIWGNTPVVSLLKVLPEYQRQGLGSRLLLAIEQHVRDRGFDVILSSTEQINEVSTKFHLKHKYEPIGSLQMPHGQENYMSKDLTNTGSAIGTVLS